jgi:hypothetical protein
VAFDLVFGFALWRFLETFFFDTVAVALTGEATAWLPVIAIAATTASIAVLNSQRVRILVMTLLLASVGPMPLVD